MLWVFYHTKRCRNVSVGTIFASRPSVTLVIFFGLESHIGKTPFLFLPYKAWANGVRVTKLVVLFNHWFMSYKVAKGRLFFQCGTLQAKNDYKCNTWSRQKLSPQVYRYRYKYERNIRNITFCGYHITLC